MNNTWYIMNIINHYNYKIKSVVKYSKEYEDLQELYAQAIRLQCKQDYGHIFTVDDFIKHVEDGYFVDYDGSGVFLLEDGSRYGTIRCDVKWLNKFRDRFSFVLWFNK